MLQRFICGGRSSSSTAGFESLEPRQLLAADPATNVFARFEGSIASGGEVSIPIALTSQNATIKGNTTSIAFLLSAAAGSTFDPATLAIRNFKNRLVTPTLARADLGGAGGNASLTVADLPLGTYTLTFRGASDEHGVIEVAAAAAAPRLGDKLRLVPGHIDPTVNLHDWIVCTRSGAVVDVWPVTARGAMW